ncbi:MAG: zinc-binding alcohol dehydrogenase family protein, partial [Actinomycetota bacterium]
MRAWRIMQPGPINGNPMVLGELDVPEPGPREIRVAVSACGVCRTDLHIAEGDLPVHKPGVVPGHEVVGLVDAIGSDVTDWSVGDRAGIAWLRHTCGSCRFCRRGDENLCESARFTGWDDDGGYAEYAVVDADYAYPLPREIDDEHAAPLLCAGIIGYRALRQSNLPTGGRLGIWGFGSSAHITAQIALAEGARVYVMTRNEKAQQLARDLGVDSVQDSAAGPPEILDSAILFA